MILNQTIIADVLVGLKQIPDNSIHCVVTSPPYWGLREYRENGKALEGQIGLEKTPEEFIEKMVAVFREVRRVLRPDGTCWINLGDSYASGKGTCFNPGGGDSSLGKDKKSEGAHPLDRGNKSDLEASGLKPKDLVGIPWRVALALQADGWWLRSDIIWSKPNPMPESVTDRPSKSHEYIFLLTKSARYFYDADAVREAHKPESIERDKHGWSAAFKGRHTQPGEKRPHSDDHNGFCNPAGRNLRSVWTIATQPSPFKHYAIFPEKLASRCIRAGTSEWGCCKSCGAPYVRVVEKDKKLMGRSSGDIYTAQAYDTPPRFFLLPHTADCGVS